MRGSSDGVISQFLCCTGRVKRASPLKEGAGIFPFECGSMISVVSMNDRSAQIFLSSVGGYLSIVTEDRVLLFESIFGETQAKDRFSLIRKFNVPAEFKRFARFCQVFAELQTSNLRVVLICEKSEDYPVLCSFEKADQTPRCFPFPAGSRGVVQACRLPGNTTVTSAIATSDGSIHFWNATSLHSSIMMYESNGISAMTADSLYLFIASPIEISIQSIPSISIASQIVARIPIEVSNINRLIRPFSKTSTGLVGSIIFSAPGSLGSISVDTGKVKSEVLSNEMITDICFGPFDNGPVMTITNRDRIIAWESGPNLRIASESECTNIRAITVSTSRQHPRIIVASWNGISKCLELKSFGLRTRQPDAIRERCI